MSSLCLNNVPCYLGVGVENTCLINSVSMLAVNMVTHIV